MTSAFHSGLESTSRLRLAAFDIRGFEPYRDTHIELVSVALEWPVSQHDDLTLAFPVFPRGTRVSHYIVSDLLGSGGMGVVYRAKDDDLDRVVALKFLPPQWGSDPRSRERFKQEAQTIAKLNHPNIVTIHEVGEHEEQPFIAMEFIDGRSLLNYYRERHVTLEQFLELAIQISEGLSEAHGRGVVHQDIKPTNIMVNKRGGVKILDFGLAALSGSSGTQDHLMQGTIQYMSPEQLQGQRADLRSDLFSLGIVLYEMLSGVHPFLADDVALTLESIDACHPAPLSQTAPGVPSELQQIVVKLLARDPDNRYQRAEDLRSDLRYARDAVLSGRLQHAPGVKEYSRSIAVLPFANLSADPGQDYFCDGIAEEMINCLTRVQGLNVAARVSSFAFKGSSESAREIGRKLHVETLLEGSVRQSGGHLRIGVQLIDVATGYHLWSEQYDDELKDVFVIQEDITRSVVSSLRLLLADDSSGRCQYATTETGAYDFYLRGRQYFNQRRKASLHFALQMFGKATEVDPRYALALVGIAECCGLLVHLYGESAEGLLARADAATLRALELDAAMPEAHAARGFTLWLLNRFDEAWSEFETAVARDPRQSETYYLYGRACFQRGEFTKAAGLFEQACKARENHEARYFAAQTHLALGEQDVALTSYRAAFRAVEQHVELNPDDARALTIGAVSLCRLGETARGLEWVEKALQADLADAGIQYNAACLFALEGQTERALECLQSAAQGGFAHRDWVERDPDLSSLRADPRFQAIQWRDSSG